MGISNPSEKEIHLKKEIQALLPNAPTTFRENQTTERMTVPFSKKETIANLISVKEDLPIARAEATTETIKVMETTTGITTGTVEIIGIMETAAIEIITETATVMATKARAIAVSDLKKDHSTAMNHAVKN